MTAQRGVASLLRKKEAGIFLALIALMILITLFNRDFASLANLSSICRQVAYIAIAALGVFVVIVTGGIDLSIAGTVALSGVMCGWALATTQHRYLPLLELGPVVAVAMGLLAGALAGAFNGAIVCYLGVTPFIVTLGSMWMAKGLVQVLTGGESLLGIPAGFIEVGNWILFPVIVLLAVAVGAHISLTYTAFGRRLYAIGGNEEATRLSGINVRRVKFMAYVICGVLSSITGILYVAKFRSALAEPHQGMELDAIAAAVIGGTSLMGGEGSVLGVLIGAMVMGVIRNGLVLVRVSSHWQQLIIGAIIVLAAILDVMRSRRK
ncbi:MAG: ABC transporter permease [Planctomycetota bacterium]|nr:ABC transporter permease [Planctomycetota bacterium]